MLHSPAAADLLPVLPRPLPTGITNTLSTAASEEPSHCQPQGTPQGSTAHYQVLSSIPSYTDPVYSCQQVLLVFMVNPIGQKFSGYRELANRFVVTVSLYFLWPWFLFCFVKFQTNIHNAQSLLSSVLVPLVQCGWHSNTCFSLKLQWTLTLYERDCMLSLPARETVFNVQFCYYKLGRLYLTHAWTCFLSVLHSTNIPNRGHILFSVSYIQNMSETFCPASTPPVVSSEPLLTH